MSLSFINAETRHRLGCVVIIDSGCENYVAKKSKPMYILHFTRGAWKTNKPVDMTLNGGATTKVRDIKPALKM